MPIKETVKQIVNIVKNEIKASVGYQQTFEELLENHDVQRAIGMLESHSSAAADNLLQYNSDTHKIMSKPHKPIFDKNGNYLRDKPVNRIAIPYHKFINEVALVFIYGRPVKWSNATTDSSDQTDDKFNRLVSTLVNARFDAHIREAKRHAGCEGCSAMLFHTYQEDEEAKLLIRVLAKSKNDDIYTLFDQYGRLSVFAWGYTTLNADKHSVHHYDIYTKDTIYFCSTEKSGTWQVDKKDNRVGKIPVIVFQQEVEWEGVQTLIDRIEDAYTKNADTNDNFGDPALVATSDIVNTLPKQEEESRLYVLKNGGDIRYLERSNTNEARQKEIDALDEQIMNKSFTPNLTLEQLRGLANASGETLRQVMLLAEIKADKRKESHDGYLSRISSLMKAIMGRVLDVRSGGYDDIVVTHEFQEPFGSDVASVLNDAIKMYGAGAMSLQTLLEQSYLVPNADKEMERINKENEEAAKLQQQTALVDVFGTAR